MVLLVFFPFFFPLLFDDEEEMKSKGLYFLLWSSFFFPPFSSFFPSLKGEMTAFPFLPPLPLSPFFFLLPFPPLRKRTLSEILAELFSRAVFTPFLPFLFFFFFPSFFFSKKRELGEERREAGAVSQFPSVSPPSFSSPPFFYPFSSELIKTSGENDSFDNISSRNSSHLFHSLPLFSLSFFSPLPPLDRRSKNRIFKPGSARCPSSSLS